MKIIGHQTQWNFLKSMAETGRIPHAFLFSGPDGLGKKKTALEFARFIIGGEKIENNPDFIFISPEFLKGNIQISQIRELIWKLSLYPYSAEYKIAVIDNAHQMNQEAQNCLLKTLEEPKGKSILILITQHPDFLLSTIISRVQKIRFFPVKRTEIESHLIKRGVSKDKAEELLNICSGRPGIALNFLENKEKIKNLEKYISDVEKIKNSDFSFRFQYAKELSKENLKEILDTWLNYFRNLLHLSLIEARPLSADRGRASISSISYSLPKIKKIINKIQTTDYLISATNINPKLALEILLMEL